jgi:hypothetical protein
MRTQSNLPILSAFSRLVVKLLEVNIASDKHDAAKANNHKTENQELDQNQLAVGKWRFFHYKSICFKSCF